MSTENADVEQRRTAPGNDPDRSLDPPAAMLRSALAGDRRQWQLLVGRYTPMLTAIAAGYRIGDEAFDAVQSTFLHLLEGGHRIRNPDALASWLGTTVRNECLRILRRRRRLGVVSTDVGWDELCPADSTSIEDGVVREQQWATVCQLVADLPSRQRDLLVLLSDADRPNYRQVSRQLGIPVGSIGPTRQRTLLRLRDELLALDMGDCA